MRHIKILGILTFMICAAIAFSFAEPTTAAADEQTMASVTDTVQTGTVSPQTAIVDTNTILGPTLVPLEGKILSECPREEQYIALGINDGRNRERAAHGPPIL